MTSPLVQKLSTVRDLRKILETTVKDLSETYNADSCQLMLSNPLDPNVTCICEFRTSRDERPGPSILSMPLTLQGRTFGSMSLSRAEDVTPQELNSMRVTLGEVGDIIRRAQINDVVQRDTFRDTFLVEIGNLMTYSLGIGDALFMVVNILGKALQVSRCLFICTDEKQSGWKCYEFWQQEKVQSCLELHWPTSSSAVIAQVLLSEGPLRLFEGQQNSYVSPVQEELDLIGVKSLLGVPLRSSEGVHGCVILQQCDYRRAFTRNEVDMVQNAADRVADALIKLPAEKRAREPIMQLHQRIVGESEQQPKKGGYGSVRKALKGALGQDAIPSARKAPAPPPALPPLPAKSQPKPADATLTLPAATMPAPNQSLTNPGAPPQVAGVPAAQTQFAPESQPQGTGAPPPQITPVTPRPLGQTMPPQASSAQVAADPYASLDMDEFMTDDFSSLTVENVSTGASPSMQPWGDIAPGAAPPVAPLASEANQVPTMEIGSDWNASPQPDAMPGVQGSPWGDLNAIPTPSTMPIPGQMSEPNAGAGVQDFSAGVAGGGMDLAQPAQFAEPSPMSEPFSAPSLLPTDTTSTWGDLETIPAPGILGAGGTQGIASARGVQPAPGQTEPGAAWGNLDSIPTPGALQSGAAGAAAAQPSPMTATWGDLDTIPTPGSPASPANSASFAAPTMPSTPSIDVTPGGGSSWGNLDSIPTPGAQPADFGASVVAAGESVWGNLDAIAAPDSASANPAAAAPAAAGGWGNLDAIGTPAAAAAASDAAGGDAGAWGSLDNIPTPTKLPTAPGSLRGSFGRRGHTAAAAASPLMASLHKDKGKFGPGEAAPPPAAPAAEALPPVEIDEKQAAEKLQQLLATTASNPTSDYIFAIPGLDARMLGRIDSWISQIEEKDKYIGGHARQVAQYCVAIAKEAFLPEEEVNIIRLAGLLHDVGKLGSAAAILQKSDEDLSDPELITVMKHPLDGAELLESFADLANLAPIVRAHHEEFDGNGYPQGLKGNEIPVAARIVRVADSYHSMIANKRFSQGMSPTDAQMALTNGAGKQWDPAYVSALIQAILIGKVPAQL